MGNYQSSSVIQSNPLVKEEQPQLTAPSAPVDGSQVETKPVERKIEEAEYVSLDRLYGGSSNGLTSPPTPRRAQYRPSCESTSTVSWRNNGSAKISNDSSVSNSRYSQEMGRSSAQWSRNSSSGPRNSFRTSQNTDGWFSTREASLDKQSRMSADWRKSLETPGSPTELPTNVHASFEAERIKKSMNTHKQNQFSSNIIASDDDDDEDDTFAEMFQSIEVTSEKPNMEITRSRSFEASDVQSTSAVGSSMDAQRGINTENDYSSTEAIRNSKDKYKEENDAKSAQDNKLQMDIGGALASLADWQRRAVAVLSVAPALVAIPLHVLQVLWSCENMQDTEANANLLHARGLLNKVTAGEQPLFYLNTGLWKLCKSLLTTDAPELHVKILRHYAAQLPSQPTASPGRAMTNTTDKSSDSLDLNAAPWHLLPEDGYIGIAIIHHLLGSLHTQPAKALLANPMWLAAVFAAHGAVQVSHLFKWYLDVTFDHDVRVLLASFQMSHALAKRSCARHALPAQMALRLGQAAKSSPLIAEWRQNVRRMLSGSHPGQGLDKATHPSGLYPPPHAWQCSASTYQAGDTTQRLPLQGHTGHITCAVPVPHSMSLITTSLDATCRIWDVSIGCCTGVLTGHVGHVYSAGLSSSGCFMVSVGADGGVHVWDVSSHRHVAFLAIENKALRVVRIDSQDVTCVTGGDSGIVHVIDIMHGQLVLCLAGHSAAITDLAFIQSGTGGAELIASASADTTARLWDAESGRCLHVLQHHARWIGGIQCAMVWEGLGSKVQPVQQGNWQDDANAEPHQTGGAQPRAVVITASQDGTAAVWDPVSGKLEWVMAGHQGSINSLHVLDTPPPSPNVPHAQYASSPTPAPSLSLCVTASDDATARVWDLSNRSCLRVLRGSFAWLAAARIFSSRSQVSMSPQANGMGVERLRVMGVAGDGAWQLWDVESGMMVHQQKAHCGECTGVTVMGCGTVGVSAGHDCNACVWDLMTTIAMHASGEQPTLAHGMPRGGVAALVLSSKHDAVVTTHDDGNVVFWTTTGEPVLTVSAHTAAVKWAVLSHDQSYLLTLSGDRLLCKWDMGSRAVIGSTATGDSGRVLSFDACSTTLQGVVALYNGCIELWDCAGLVKLRVLRHWNETCSVNNHTTTINAVYAARNTPYALTVDRAGEARVWSLNSAACVCVMRGHREQVVAGAIAERLHEKGSSGGHVIATCGYDNTVRVWSRHPDNATPSLLLGLTLPYQPTSLALAPNLECLVVLSKDNSMHVLSLDTSIGKPRVYYVPNRHSIMSSVVFSEDSKYLAIICCDDSLYVVRVKDCVTIGVFLSDVQLTQCRFVAKPPKPRHNLHNKVTSDGENCSQTSELTAKSPAHAMYNTHFQSSGNKAFPHTHSVGHHLSDSDSEVAQTKQFLADVDPFSGPPSPPRHSTTPPALKLPAPQDRAVSQPSGDYATGSTHGADDSGRTQSDAFIQESQIEQQYATLEQLKQVLVEQLRAQLIDGGDSRGGNQAVQLYQLLQHVKQQQDQCQMLLQAMGGGGGAAAPKDSPSAGMVLQSMGQTSGAEDEGRMGEEGNLFLVAGSVNGDVKVIEVFTQCGQGGSGEKGH